MTKRPDFVAEVAARGGSVDHIADSFERYSFDQDKWIAAGCPVRGHVCPDLTLIQGFMRSWSDRDRPVFAPRYGSCTPVIDPRGVMVACDDENLARFRFCPGCGAALTGDGREFDRPPGDGV